MKKLIDDLSEFYAENVRLVKDLMKRESPKEFPELMKWSLQMLYFFGNEWVSICRIDNHLHQGKSGSHIHAYKRKKIERVDLSFQEAEKVIKKISKRILKVQFKENIAFGDDEHEL